MIKCYFSSSFFCSQRTLPRFCQDNRSGSRGSAGLSFRRGPFGIARKAPTRVTKGTEATSLKRHVSLLLPVGGWLLHFQETWLHSAADEWFKTLVSTCYSVESFKIPRLVHSIPLRQALNETIRNSGSSLALDTYSGHWGGPAQGTGIRSLFDIFHNSKKERELVGHLRPHDS